MNSRHRQTQDRLFADPVNGNLEWRRIEALFLTLGVEVIAGCGSRVTFLLRGTRRDFHRPHPSKEALRYRVLEARAFLQEAGFEP
jgi:hypothetical protein